MNVGVGVVKSGCPEGKPQRKRPAFVELFFRAAVHIYMPRCVYCFRYHPPPLFFVLALSSSHGAAAAATFGQTQDQVSELTSRLAEVAERLGEQQAKNRAISGEARVQRKNSL